MILKRIISFLVLTMYLHGMSGYTMSFHKCNITGFENVYTGFGSTDPCMMDKPEDDGTNNHYEPVSCCDVQHTVISIDDDSNISSFKTTIGSPTVTFTFVQSYLFLNTKTTGGCSYSDLLIVRPPESSITGVFRI